MPRVIAPVEDPDDAFFWGGVKDHKLLVRRCTSCSRLQHPPSPMCPDCGSVAWEVEELSGDGTVHSWIISHHPTELDEQPRIVALIDLAEGVRLVSNLQSVTPNEVRNDMPVTVTFTNVDGVELPQFVPSEEHGR